jgi:pimeloyl-ACP methyl ester carboxylesterase
MAVQMASTGSEIDWNTVPSASSLVSIGTHYLHLFISGSPRQDPRKPLIIVFPGAGDISSSWVPLSRLIAPSFRILLYDRSGLGRSPPRPKSTPTPLHMAVTAAKELHTALDASHLVPPYVLCAHSYGAIIAREFLHLWPNEVVGMALVEGSTERQCQFFRVPDPNIQAVMGDLNFARVTGLREAAGQWMKREEWRERARLIAGGVEAAGEEIDAFVEVCETLGVKKQMQKRTLCEKPLSIIRSCGRGDYEAIYDTGVQAGNGSLEQRKAFKGLLEKWDVVDKELKEEQLKLSRNSRLVFLPDCGHNVQLLRPDVVASEIRWVMDSIQKSGIASL